MIILHISGARSWGGNEQQLINLVLELKKHNVESNVFGVKDSPLHINCKNKKINFVYGNSKKLTNFKNYKFLKTIITNSNPSLIHLHTSDSVTLFVISDILYKLNTPTVFSKKGISSSVSYLSKLKYNYKNIDKIVCVSEVVKNHFNSALKLNNHNKLCVVYDGVTLQVDQTSSMNLIRKDYLINNDIHIIGNIANHTKAKDLKTFIRVLDVIVNKKGIKNIHFFQIGSFSKSTNELKELIKSLNLTEYITLAGFKQNASKYLPEFDLFLMTSKREGGPTSVLEAFRDKTPVVSTKVGIVNEVIKDGINGFSSNIEDFNDLAIKVLLLVNNSELKNIFADKSYEVFLNNFTTELLGKNTLNVYKEVINK